MHIIRVYNIAVKTFKLQLCVSTLIGSKQVVMF